LFLKLSSAISRVLAPLKVADPSKSLGGLKEGSNHQDSSQGALQYDGGGPGQNPAKDENPHKEGESATLKEEKKERPIFPILGSRYNLEPESLLPSEEPSSGVTPAPFNENPVFERLSHDQAGLTDVLIQFRNEHPPEPSKEATVHAYSKDKKQRRAIIKQTKGAMVDKKVA